MTSFDLGFESYWTGETRNWFSTTYDLDAARNGYDFAANLDAALGGIA